MNPASPAPPTIEGFPRAFGSYLLLAPLAHGGMGEVFLATRLAAIEGAVRLVVIKTLRPDLAKEKGYVGRFLDEARIAIQLTHQNIAQTFDAGCHNGTYFIAMEHIEGTTLRQLTKLAHDAVPTPVALMTMAEVLDALDAAHRHKHPLTREALCVVHRDVSPQNVMLSYDGEVKVIDFGLAASKIKLEETESNVVLGKIAYMSPEQATGAVVDGRTDQYSAGVMLYELLTGERFYGKRSNRDIWLVAGDPPLPAKWFALDPPVRHLLERALAKNRDARFPTCAEFATALRAYLHEKFPAADRALLRTFVTETSNEERVKAEQSLVSVAPVLLAQTPLTVTSVTALERTRTNFIVDHARNERNARALYLALALALTTLFAVVVPMLAR